MSNEDKQRPVKFVDCNGNPDVVYIGTVGHMDGLAALGGHPHEIKHDNPDIQEYPAPEHWIQEGIDYAREMDQYYSQEKV